MLYANSVDAHSLTAAPSSAGLTHAAVTDDSSNRPVIPAALPHLKQVQRHGRRAARLCVCSSRVRMRAGKVLPLLRLLRVGAGVEGVGGSVGCAIIDARVERMGEAQGRGGYWLGRLPFQACRVHTPDDLPPHTHRLPLLRVLDVALEQLLHARPQAVGQRGVVLPACSSGCTALITQPADEGSRPWTAGTPCRQRAGRARASPCGHRQGSGLPPPVRSPDDFSWCRLLLLLWRRALTHFTQPSVTPKAVTGSKVALVLLPWQQERSTHKQRPAHLAYGSLLRRLFSGMPRRRIGRSSSFVSATTCVGCVVGCAGWVHAAQVGTSYHGCMKCGQLVPPSLPCSHKITTSPG